MQKCDDGVDVGSLGGEIILVYMHMCFKKKLTPFWGNFCLICGKLGRLPVVSRKRVTHAKKQQPLLPLPLPPELRRPLLPLDQRLLLKAELLVELTICAHQAREHILGFRVCVLSTDACINTARCRT